MATMTAVVRYKSCIALELHHTLFGVMECDGIPLVMTPSHLFAHHVMSRDVIVV